MAVELLATLPGHLACAPLRRSWLQVVLEEPERLVRLPLHVHSRNGEDQAGQVETERRSRLHPLLLGARKRDRSDRNC